MSSEHLQDQIDSIKTTINSRQDDGKSPVNRRSYLKLAGIALGIGSASTGSASAASTDGYGVNGYGSGPYGDASSLTVKTNDATSVDGSSGTLHGTLSELGDASSADVYFEWGEAGSDLANVTNAEALSSTGSFSAEVSDLSSGTEYEYRALGEGSNDETDAGTRASFETDGGDAAPTIDTLVVSEAGSPNPHAEITADWVVSDADADLDSVVVSVRNSDGDVLDAARTNASGATASNTDGFKFKHAGSQRFTVRLLVTDAADNSAERSSTVSS